MTTNRHIICGIAFVSMLGCSSEPSLSHSQGAEVATDTTSAEPGATAPVAVVNDSQIQEAPAFPDTLASFRVYDAVQVGSLRVVLLETPLKSIQAMFGGSVRPLNAMESYLCYAVTDSLGPAGELAFESWESPPPSEPAHTAEWSTSLAALTCDETAHPQVKSFGPGFFLGMRRDSIRAILGPPTPFDPEVAERMARRYGVASADLDVFQRNEVIHVKHPYSLTNDIIAIFNADTLVKIVMWKARESMSPDTGASSF